MRDGWDTPADWLGEYFCHWVHESGPTLCGERLEDHEISVDGDHDFIGLADSAVIIQTIADEIRGSN